MNRQVGLLVPVEIKRAHMNPLPHSGLENSRGDFFTVQQDRSRNSNLHGNQHWTQNATPWLARRKIPQPGLNQIRLTSDSITCDKNISLQHAAFRFA